MSRRFSNDSTKSSSSLVGKRGVKVLKTDTKDEFNWDKYLQQTSMPAAPPECFKQQVFDDSMPNKFRVSDKLEAKDARNLAAISVATVVSIQGPRLCLKLDGTDGCNNFWRLIDSKDIFPIGTCEAHGGLLQPPLGFTRNVSTWPTFLQRTLNKAKNNRASSDCFHQEPEGPDKNLFEVGMKLEAVDKKNAQLICPATIGDIDGDQIFISFDGWRGAFDYWSNYDSRDLFPVGWCQANNHPLQIPGQKGDNPVVLGKLKALAQESKRQTRSVKNNLESKPPPKETPTLSQTKEKPVRRRRVDSIKASSLDKEDTELSRHNDLSNNPSLSPPLPPTMSDASFSSDDSESSHEEAPEKRPRLDNEDDGEFPNQSTSGENNITSVLQYSDETLMKLQRKERKQKRKQKKLAKALKRAGIAEGQIGEIKEDSVEVSLNLTPQQIALLTSPRKRSLEGDFVKSKLKKKKKRRSLMESSSYTRMEGFGVKSTDTATTTASATSPTSPSFLDALTAPPPTSLFGGDKSQIVRNATQGWPARLQMGSVVTSDNKLGRFDKNVSEKPQEPKETPKETADVHIQPAVVTSHCVSTTTTEAERISFVAPPENSDRTTPSPFVTSTTTTTEADVEEPNEENSDKVSSTTNPSSSNDSQRNSSSSSVTPPPISRAQLPATKVTSTVANTPSGPGHVRSRNPTKWSISDVISYVREKEPALSSHLVLFQKHQIDGKALLLLNSNNIVKYMELKLGPALKLCNLVEKLKAAMERHSRHKARKRVSESER